VFLCHRTVWSHQYGSISVRSQCVWKSKGSVPSFIQQPEENAQHREHIPLWREGLGIWLHFLVSEEVVLLQGKESATNVIFPHFLADFCCSAHVKLWMCTMCCIKFLSLLDGWYLICLRHPTLTSGTLKSIGCLLVLVEHEDAGWMAEH